MKKIKKKHFKLRILHRNTLIDTKKWPSLDQVASETLFLLSTRSKISMENKPSLSFLEFIFFNCILINETIKSKAMKIIKSERERERESNENELVTLWKINHENIVKYYEHFENKMYGRNCTCIITEYCQVFTILTLNLLLRN